MISKKCCRTCKHCFPDQVNLFFQCRLRTIKIHSEISTFAFCHHWMKKEPNLPISEDKINHIFADRQLDFGKVLVQTE